MFMASHCCKAISAPYLTPRTPAGRSYQGNHIARPRPVRLGNRKAALLRRASGVWCNDLWRSSCSVGALALALVVGASGDLAAKGGDSDDGQGIITFQIENDVIAGTDRNYTNGGRLTYLSPEVTPEHWSGRAAAALPTFGYGDKVRYSFSLGQSMFTPEDTGEETLIVGDRPYAAWLYGRAAVLFYDDARDDAGDLVSTGQLQTLAVDLGIVGPWALGEEVQNNFHNLIGVEEAEGWANQIENEPGIMISYESAWRNALQFPSFGDFGVEFMPHLGVTLGNVMTYGAVGGSARIGFNLPDDFGPPRIQPSLPGSGFFRPSDGVGFYFFGGVESRAVARNIFLDGNSFRDSHSIDRNYFVGDAQFGAAVTYGDVRLTLAQVLRSPEIEGSATDRFASLSLSYRLDF